MRIHSDFYALHNHAPLSMNSHSTLYASVIERSVYGVCSLRGESILVALPRARLVVKVDIGQVDRTGAQDVAVVLLDPHALALAFKVPAYCQCHIRRIR
jgi:hypothetical protein